MVDNTTFTLINGVKVQTSGLKNVKDLGRDGTKEVALKNGMTIEIGQGAKPKNAIIMTDYFELRDCEEDEDTYYANIDKDLSEQEIDLLNTRYEFINEDDGGVNFDSKTVAYNLPESVRIKGGEKNDCVYLQNSACDVDVTKGGFDHVLYDKDSKANVQKDVIDAESTVIPDKKGELKVDDLDYKTGDNASIIIGICAEDLDDTGKVDAEFLEEQLEKLFENVEGNPFAYMQAVRDISLVASGLNSVMLEHGIDNSKYFEELRNEIQNCECTTRSGTKFCAFPDTLVSRLKELIKNIANIKE